MNLISHRIRSLAQRFGYDIIRFKPARRGIDPLWDIQSFLAAEPSPVIADIGANTGQSIRRLKAVLPGATLHCFEPSPTTFATLQQNAAAMGYTGVHLWNHGVGAKDGTLTFLENTSSVMSSFLPPGELCSGEVTRSTTVPVRSLDSFAQGHKIPFFHLVKSDTQGYEYQVFEGARDLFIANRVGMILFEYIVSDMYRGVARLDTVLGHLFDHGFSLAAVYNQKFQRSLLSWVDILVINNEYYRLNRLGDAAGLPSALEPPHAREKSPEPSPHGTLLAESNH